MGVFVPIVLMTTLKGKTTTQTLTQSSRVTNNATFTAVSGLYSIQGH